MYPPSSVSIHREKEGVEEKEGGRIEEEGRTRLEDRETGAS